MQNRAVHVLLEAFAVFCDRLKGVNPSELSHKVPRPETDMAPDINRAPPIANKPKGGDLFGVLVRQLPANLDPVLRLDHPLLEVLLVVGEPSAVK
jgi:hypothetical protein